MALVRLAAARFALTMKRPRRREPRVESDVAADRVSVYGVVWWVPRDGRVEGTLSDRLVRGSLPVSEILQTRRFIAPGAMIDIGANVGTTSITRLLLGHVEYVYAIEPDPANCVCLLRTAEDNGLDDRLTVDTIALGSRDGDVAMVRGEHIGAHRLVTPESRSASTATMVRAMTLDSWGRWRACDPKRVTFIKCDTQGWEDHILRGAEGWLSHRHITWELELCPRLLDKSGSSLAGICERLQAHFTWFVELRAARWNLRRLPIRDVLTVVERALDKPRNYTNVIAGN
jgi:FkbM family methyltransferase